jgi:8-oxo-dGTP pyrophosphatase MutT (NUDIX family)
MPNEKAAVRKAKKGRPIRQVAAIPFRLRDGRPEVMLVTSRGTRRFIVPKGWPMKGKDGRQAALIEAREEAGVTGHTRKEPLGKYRYWKRLSDAFVPVEVTVFLLIADDVLPEWKEAATRERAWLSPADAATLIDEPELATLVSGISVDSVSSSASG